MEFVSNKGIKVFPFIEPDIGNQLTAFSTEIIPEEKTNIFKKFQCFKV